MRVQYILIISLILSFNDVICQNDILMGKTPHIWLSADKNINNIANKVISWTDQSNNFVFEQNNASLQPTIATDIELNNQPYLAFNNNALSSLAQFQFNDATIIVFAKQHSGESNFSRLIDHDFQNGFWLGRELVSSNIGGGFIEAANPFGNFQNINNDWPFTVALTRSNDTSFYRLNDAAFSIPFRITSNQQTQLNKIAIGSDLTESNFFAIKDVYEVIIYNESLSDEELDTVTTYLKYKYFPRPLGSDIQINNATLCPVALTVSDNTMFPGSYLWSTGETTVSINAADTGSYWIEAINKYGVTLRDTLRVTSEYQYKTDSTICVGDSLFYDSGLGLGYSYLWNTGSIKSIDTLTVPGKYFVEISNGNGCNFIDTIVFIDSFPTLTSLGPDKTICQGAALGLMSNTNPTSYLWNTSAITPQIVINTVGQYWLQSSNANGCINKDTINITLNGIAPTVGFTALNLCDNAPVQFSDTSFTTDGTNINNWFWDFGDGNASALQNPTHLYSNDTSYLVTLRIQTDGGCENTTTQTILIHKKPIAGFFSTTTPICSGKPINFTDNSFSSDGIITSWFWDFGDTGINDTSNLKNPTYSFSAGNNYNVQHIVSSQFNCKDTVTNPLNVKETPVPSFTTANLCFGDNTLFTNTSQGSIQTSFWYFGDGNNSFLTNPTHTYSASSTYNVSLKVTAVNACIDTLIAPVTINENPTAKYTPTDFCVLTAKQFFDSSTVVGSITNWDWNVINHSNQSNTQNPTFNFTASDVGFYYLDLSVTNNLGCKDSIRDSINVYPLPIPIFSLTPTIGAAPLLVNFSNQTNGTNSYYWNFGDGSFSTNTSPTHTYLDSNFYNINLIATSASGCIDSTSQLIKIIPPIVDVAVLDVNYTISADNNFLTVFTQLANLGAFDVNSIELVLTTSSAGIFLENWQGNLTIGSQDNYTFSSSLKIVNGVVPDLICVTASKPNGVADDVLSNNEYCISLTKFVLLSMYPNPASDNLNLQYIIPSDGKVTINLYNSIGAHVASLKNETAKKGLNRNLINLKSYQSGTYFIEILFDGNTIRETLIIH